MAEKYNASNIALEQILNFIKSGEIAIPEIQRPFVWKPKQVRVLIVSLFGGYTTGYLFISQSANFRIIDGTRELSGAHRKHRIRQHELDEKKHLTRTVSEDDIL